jgi:hypothetical protein
MMTLIFNGIMTTTTTAVAATAITATNTTATSSNSSTAAAIQGAPGGNVYILGGHIMSF